MDVTFWGPVRDPIAPVSGLRDLASGTMEALRTKVDSLEWDLHRLTAENRQLREANTEASERLDELERTKNEVTELADRVRELERQFTSVAEGAGNRAERAETRAAELEERRCEEAATERSEAEAREAELRAMTWRSEEDLLETRRELAGLTVRFEESDQQSCAASDASLQQAELSVTERQKRSGRRGSHACVLGWRLWKKN